jgi:hypothetical protein
VCKHPAINPVQALLSNSVRKTVLDAFPPTAEAAEPPAFVTVLAPEKANAARAGCMETTISADNKTTAPKEVTTFLKETPFCPSWLQGMQSVGV